MKICKLFSVEVFDTLANGIYVVEELQRAQYLATNVMVRTLFCIYKFDGNVSLFNHGAENVIPKCSIVEIQ